MQQNQKQNTSSVWFLSLSTIANLTVQQNKNGSGGENLTSVVELYSWLDALGSFQFETLGGFALCMLEVQKSV